MLRLIVAYCKVRLLLCRPSGNAPDGYKLPVVEHTHQWRAYLTCRICHRANSSHPLNVIKIALPYWTKGICVMSGTNSGGPYVRLETLGQGGVRDEYAHKQYWGYTRFWNKYNISPSRTHPWVVQLFELLPFSILILYSSGNFISVSFLHSSMNWQVLQASDWGLQPIVLAWHMTKPLRWLWSLNLRASSLGI